MSNIKGTYKDDKGVVRDIREMPNLALEVMKMEAEAQEVDEAEAFLEDLVSVKKEDVLFALDVPDSDEDSYLLSIANAPAMMTLETREDGIIVSQKFIDKHGGTKYSVRTYRFYRYKTDRIRARRRRERQAANRRKKR